MRRFPWKKKAGDDSSVDEVVKASKLLAKEQLGLFELEHLASDEIDAVDIVAVHGLGGHFQETWTSTESKKLWLRDFLPDNLRSEDIKARVFSYGYNSNMIFSRSVNDIDTEAQGLLVRLHGKRRSSAERERPIIFISHSLGGVVVKKSMIYAHDRRREFGDLLDKIRGLVFFGVPHRGSDIAFWGKFATELSKGASLNFTGNANFVAEVRSNSTAFAQISTQSIERLQSDSIVIRTFYESERLGNQVIVDATSAVLGLTNERALQIAGTNHLSVCKFEDKDSQAYEPVRIAIVDLANMALVPFESPAPVSRSRVQNRGAALPRQAHSIKAGSLVAFSYWGRTAPTRGEFLFHNTRNSDSPRYRAFSEPYLEPPRVLVGLTVLDYEKGFTMTARATTSQVTPFGFCPLLEYWLDTRCHHIGGSFLEIAPGDSEVQTGRCSSYGILKRNRDSLDVHTMVRHVPFYRPYITAPEVACWIVHIHSDPRSNHRMSVEAKNITTNGFDVEFSTWRDSILNEVEAEWIAIPIGRGDMYVIPHTVTKFGDSKEEKSTVNFPPGKFSTPPACFLALTRVEANNDHNARVRLAQTEVSCSQITISIGTWDESVSYSLGFMGIAISGDEDV